MLALILLYVQHGILIMSLRKLMSVWLLNLFGFELQLLQQKELALWEQRKLRSAGAQKPLGNFRNLKFWMLLCSFLKLCFVSFDGELMYMVYQFLP